MTRRLVGNAIVCIGGPIVEHVYQGRTYRWEQHPYLGPWPVRRDGEPFTRAPGERSAFWRAYEEWERMQGGGT